MATRLPIHAALEDGYPERIPALVKKGADINAKDWVGVAPLHVSVSRVPNPYATDLLLKNGADVNLKTQAGYTALHLASLDPNGVEAVNLLLAAGADINATDPKGRTAVDLATGATKEVLQRVLGQAGLKRVAKAKNLPEDVEGIVSDFIGKGRRRKTRARKTKRRLTRRRK